MIRLNSVSVTPNCHYRLTKTNKTYSTEQTSANNMQNVTFKHNPLTKSKFIDTLQKYISSVTQFFKKEKKALSANIIRNNDEHFAMVKELNSKSKPFRTTFYKDTGDTISHVEEYDHKGRVIKDSIYDSVSKKVNQVVVTSYAPNSDVTKKITYQPDLSTIKYIDYYKNNQINKRIHYKKDSKNIRCVKEYNNGQIQKEVWYDNDGVTRSSIDIYKKIDPNIDTTYKARTIWFKNDGETINYIEEFDSKNKTAKKIYLNENNRTIKNIKEYSYDGEVTTIKNTTFSSGQKNVVIEEYVNNSLIKKTHMKSDGITKDYSEEYRGEKMKLIKYNPDNTIKSVTRIKY